MSASRILVRALLGLLALVLLLVGFVLIVATTPWGQGFVTNQVNSYLAGKIKSPFHIGRIRYDIPDYLELEDVFFQTPQGDTLLNGGRLRVDLDMWGLLNSRVAINEILLERTQVNIRRTLPAPNAGPPTFNFAYLIDAFVTPDTAATPTDSSASSLVISLNRIRLNDVRIRYRDDVVGADVNAYVDSLRTTFREMNIDKSRYHIEDLTVDGLNVTTRLYDGLPSPPDEPESVGDTLDIGLGKWVVNRAKWDIDVQTADFKTKGSAGKLLMESDYLYLDGQKIGISSLTLENSDIAATLTKPTRKAAAPAPATPATGPGWFAKLNTVHFANNRIRYDDETAAPQAKGLDYGHLDLKNLGIDGKTLVYQDLGPRGQRISGQLRNGQFKAGSGFVLQQLNGDLLYTDRTTQLTNLLIKTPTSLIRDQLVLRYDSLGQLSDPRFASRVQVRATLNNSRLSVADVLQLAPFLADTPPFSNSPGAVFRANAQVTGTLAALNLPRVELDLLSGTHLRMNGKLTDVTNPDRIGLDLNITDATTRLADINKLIPPGTIPQTVALPPLFDLTGKLKGPLNDLVIDAKLATDWGSAAFDGRVAGFVAGKNQTYKGTLNLVNFDAGKWTKQPETVGKITGRATVNGRGIDVNTLTTDFDLAIQSAQLQGYTYQNFDAKGNLTNGNLDISGSINDPNASATFDTKVNLKPAFPSVVGQVVLNQLNLKPLGFYADPLSLKGRILLDMASVDPEKPVGTVSAADAVVTLDGKSYPVDSLYAKLSAEGDTKRVLAQLPGARLTLNGQFQYASLYDMVAGEIAKYIALPGLSYKPVAGPYAFTTNVKAYQNPLFKAFVPALTRLDTVTLNAFVTSQQPGTAGDTTLSATLRTGTIIYDTITVQNANLNLRGTGNQLAVNGKIDGVLYSGYTIRETNLTGTAANNRFAFDLVNKDSVNQDRFGLAGTLSIVDSSYRFQFARNGLLTNYERWQTDTSGFAQYGSSGVLVNRLRLEQGRQTIEVNSTEQYPNAPLRITTQAIELGYLTKLAGQDTTLAAGQLNGTVIVRDYLSSDSQLAFTGSVYVDSLRVMQQPIGDLTARFSNNTDGRISVNTVLAGKYNDATVAGYYNPENPKSALDLAIDLKRLDARTIEAFSFGELRRASGKLTGNIKVAGSLDNPQTDGSVAFDSVAFNVKQLNATYRINDENILFRGQTITFNDFAVTDTLGQALTTDGTVVLKNLPNAAYNLRIQANKFLVMNASRKDNEFAYGRATATLDLRVKGEGSDASVTGKIKVDEGSNISLVLPDDALAADVGQGIVTFIDHRDSLALRKYIYQPKLDTTNTKRLQFDQLARTNISLDLEVDEKSELTIVVDELNGDYLRARGNAQLNVSVDAAGNLAVLGRYDVTEGEYSLTYEVLKRQFEIQKGGYINFTGDPLKADINMTALYKVDVPPADLIANESSNLDANALKRKLPFVVALTISDNIAQPKLDFDIRLPELDNNTGSVSSSPFATAIENKLKALRQDQSQINKQVFALLILNRFLPENTSDFFSGSSGGGLDSQAESVARSSVSKLLSEQLGRLASGVLNGIVDVDFNLLSQSGGANTGGNATGARTDLALGLSKSFANGRVTVSVGKNFVLENTAGTATSQNQVFDNISVNYKVTPDGRYMLRGYRQNDYQAVLDGYIIETGVGFVITVDFNTLAGLFGKDKTLN